MNILINKLPTKVNGVEINTDFRVSILFELLMHETKIRKDIKVMKALQLYYPDFKNISNFETAIKQMLWFYRCGKELANSKKINESKSNRKNQIYSYEFDDIYIYDAFLQQYNIDLQEIKYMHWWKFKALFDGLTEETQIIKIMQYRSVNLSQIKDAEKRNYYKKMKRLYALPDMRTQEEKEREFAEKFL